MWWSCHLMRCDCLCCVMSRDAMRCPVMCAHVMCPAMVTLCVRSGSVTSLYYKVLLQYYSVLQSTTPVLLCTTQYYNVLLQYYSVLQSTTPVLPCTTKYYSSTTLYCKVLLQYYSVLQSTTPVLLCTAKYYSSTTLYYKVLLQYYSVLHYTVLQRTTPVLPCTTKYNSSTSLHYKVLLQYYSVLHSTTTYYSSTTLYYKAAFIIDPWHIWTVIYLIDVRRIWNVIYNARSNRSHPPTSPNTAPATKNGSHDWCPSHMKRHLQCAEQQASPSNLTKYCACHVTWLSWLILVTYETSFTMRGATGITLQPHQILRLPRKMMRIIGCRDSWNVIYNARSNRHHPPTSPNTAPATKNDAHHWSSSHMKRHLQCAEQQASPSNLTKYCTCHAKWLSWLMSVTYETSFTMRGATSITLQPHQILRLPRKIGFQNLREIVRKQLKCHLQCAADSSMIRTWSEHDPTMNSSSRTRPFAEVTFRASKTHFVLKITTFRAPAIYPDFTEYCACHKKWHSKITKCCACHEKWFSWLISVIYETSFTMRGATSITLQPHQILRLPRKIAFQNLREIVRKQLKCHLQCAADSSMIRTWSEHDPTMNSSSRTRPFAEVTFRASKTHFVLKITTFRAPAIYPDFTEYCACHKKWHSKITKCCACHEKWFSWLISVTYETSFTMRGATSITLQPHQILRLPRKIAFQNLREIVRKQLKCHLQCAADSSMIRTWSEHDPTMNSSSRTRPFAEVTFRASKTHFVLKITTFRAPAIYPDFTEYCACHKKWHSKITKCCACHEKWFSWLISVTYETSFTMRGATSITLQPHQILRLPRKMALMIDVRHIWNVIYNARSNKHHPPTSPNTAPATQNCIPKS